MDRISVIVPCFNEEEALPLFYERVRQVLSEMEPVEYELLFVDDGSQDQTLAILKMMAQVESRVRYLSFSRNFGKEAAMYAGLREFHGDYAVIMDADLQHPPELLPQMYRILKTEPVDCAGAMREDREGEGRVRNLLSGLFYKVIDRLAEVPMKDGQGDYRMMSRRMAEAVVSMKEYNRYSKGLFQFVGFETRWLPYHNQERAAGRSKWSFWKLLRYAADGIMSFSSIPLTLASVCGMGFCVFACLMGLYVAGKTLLFGNPTDGWTTLVCILLFSGGIQLFFTGVVGQYLSKNYMESKHRPLYILKETNLEKPC